MKIIRGTDLYPYIHGVLDLGLDETGAVCFHRFTKKQRARYAEAGAEQKLNYAERADSSSGVTLEMITDSAILGMNFQLAAGCRDFAGFDCYVDGVLHDHWYNQAPFYNVLCFDLPKGEHLVQVFFPWAVITKLSRVVLSEGASASSVKKDLRILAYGDSITQGYITTHPSLSYVNLFARELNAECVNQAIGGYYFEDLTLDDALAEFKPDLITIAYGTNDYTMLGNGEDIRKNCEDYMKRIRQIFPDTKILGLLPIHRNDERNAARNKMNEFRLSDACALIRDIYKKIPGVTVLEDTYFPQHNDFFAPDHLHPNDLGFLFYGRAVTEALRKML